MGCNLLQADNTSAGCDSEARGRNCQNVQDGIVAAPAPWF